MAHDVERFIRVQNRDMRPGASGLWRTIPNCEKLRVWEHLTLLAHDEETGADERRTVFHIHFVEGIRRGSRVTYLGNAFTVLTVSDSKRLVGVCRRPFERSTVAPRQFVSR